jgi:hypothetical protein
MRSVRYLLIAACLTAIACVPHVRAAEVKPESGTVQFEGDVLPIFKAHCVRCHNATNRKAELDLSTAAGLLKGSESGPIVAAGKVDESLLYDMVHEGLMPPEKKDSLADRETETIRRWIAAGAPFASAGNRDTSTVVAETPSQHDIGPLMLLRCAVCHGLRKQDGGLDLRTKASMLKGGKSGPAIVLGQPDASLAIQKIHSGEMPPRKKLQEASVHPISEEETKKFAAWIAAGAPELDMPPDVASREPDPLVTDQDRQFWSFQPPKKVKPPAVKNATRVRNPLDAFLLERLETQGLSFAPEADLLILMRRAAFDLTGLPPEVNDIKDVVSKHSPSPTRALSLSPAEGEKIYEAYVDKLLASPRYGERWGRHWLDLAGYADSEGKRSQDPIRPDAYRYRDYVIRSFNDDKPYDRFLLEQIAGDELADYEYIKELTPELLDNLVATGFLRMAPDGTGSDVVNFVPERLEVIADEIDIFSSTVLGLTIKCARCHSHKYDPIPQRDYYRLVDIFKGAYDEHDWLKPDLVASQTKAKSAGRALPCALPAEREAWQAENRKLQEQIDALTAKKNEPEYKDQAKQLDKQIKDLEAKRPTEPKVRALWDRGQPSPTYIYRRGDYLSPGRLVGPGVPSVLTNGRTPFDVSPPWPGAKSTGRRLALAKWLVEPEHPLTARVMVNRIWKQHFGVGIVKTTDNFGHTGAQPTHPELLDWLAREFVRQGWSQKAIHRLIMTSSAYRQSSITTSEQLRLDPENQLVSRMPLKRMEAEVLRDSLLAVSGRLDETRFGPGDSVDVRSDGLVTPIGSDKGWRRSVYVRQRRKEIPTILEAFDLPQMNPSCIERPESTVASQALHLFNNGQVHELAQALAARLQREASTDAAQQVDHLFLVALSRLPTSDERTACLETLNKLAPLEKQPLVTLCHTILNSAAFIYID